MHAAPDLHLRPRPLPPIPARREPGLTARAALTFKMTWRYASGGGEVEFSVDDKYNGPQSDFDLDCDDADNKNFERTGLKFGTYKSTASQAGDVTITLRGHVQELDVKCNSNLPNTLISIPKWGLNPWRRMERLFVNCTALETVNPAPPNLTQVSSLTAVFIGATAFTGNVDNWDTSNITLMRATFSHAHKFNGSLKKWDVSNVTSMNSMFHDASVFNGEISGWDVSKVDSMGQMFRDADKFRCDISGWDVEGVKTWGKIFEGCNIRSDHKPEKFH